MSSILIELGIILVLILANGLFAASEIAIVSARRGRLEQQAHAGKQGAAAAIELAENPSRFLATVQVGITVIGTFAAAFGGANLARLLEPLLASVPMLERYAPSLALALVVVLISYLSLILGELTPKRLALQRAEAVAAAVAPLMRTLASVARPIVYFLTLSTEVVLGLLGRRDVKESAVTEEDIIALVREGTQEGTVEETEQQMIHNVFALTDRSVRSIMTPRTEMTVLAIDTPLAGVLQRINDSGYSRIPVYGESHDHIVGLLYAKDLLGLWGAQEDIDLAGLLRAPLFVLESQRATIVFQELKRQRGGMAIVVDEYGQVAGLVTLEDILEEVVGDIDDEYDDATETIVAREDGSYLVDGLLSFAALQAQLHLPDVTELAESQEYETVAGFVLALLGHIPSVGEVATWRNYSFEVVDMDRRRIDKVLLVMPKQAQAEESAMLGTDEAGKLHNMNNA